MLSGTWRETKYVACSIGERLEAPVDSSDSCGCRSHRSHAHTRPAAVTRVLYYSMLKWPTLFRYDLGNTESASSVAHGIERCRCLSKWTNVSVTAGVSERGSTQTEVSISRILFVV